MNDYIHYIEQQLLRFSEGMTTMAEEQELYTFFSSNQVPPHLERYRSVFHYFAIELAEEVATDTVAKQADKISFMEQPRNKVLILAASAAIIVALLIPALLYMAKEHPFDPYQDSYMVKDGQRINKIENVAALRIAIEHEMEEKENDIDELYRSMDEAFDKYTTIETRRTDK